MPARRTKTKTPAPTTPATSPATTDAAATDTVDTPATTPAKAAPRTKRSPATRGRSRPAPAGVSPAKRKLPKASSSVLDAARAKVSQLRRDAARDKLLTFARTYLPGHFRLEPSAMHTEIAALLETGLVQRGQRLAIAAPRGHAKSTLVSLALVLWATCYERERFIQIISDTSDQAIDLLGAVKGELESNELLREDFPGACELPGRPPGPDRWKKNDIIARNKVRILAMGAEQKNRGRRHGADRPSLIILDDIENEALARSIEQREARWRWLTSSVLSSGSSTTNIIAVGTVLHHDSVLARLLDPKKTHAWTTRRYRAITAWAERKDLWQAWEGIYTQMDEHQGRTGPEAARAYFEASKQLMLAGAGVLWPQLQDYHALMAQRMEMGRAVFDAEKLNDPSDPEDAVFVETDFHYWDDTYPDAQALIAAFGSKGTVYGACDPSLGRAGRNADDSAIVTILKCDETDRMFVLDADIRRRSPDQIIETILTFDRARHFSRFGVEQVQFQEFLKTELERRAQRAGRRLRVKGITQTTDKRGRIQSLQPLMSTGMLLFSRRHSLLIEQLRRFPHAAHDDGPDALEMAVRTGQVFEPYGVELAYPLA